MLGICTSLYNSLWNFFILYNRSLISLKQCYFLPSHSPPVTTVLFAVAKSLILLDTTYKWHHAVTCFLWLTDFTKHTVLKVHPCCSMCQNFILFSGWVVFPCRYRSHFFIHSSVDGHLGWFYLLAIVTTQDEHSCEDISSRFQCLLKVDVSGTPPWLWHC